MKQQGSKPTFSPPALAGQEKATQLIRFGRHGDVQRTVAILV
jgi:hypothetical protein